MAIITSFSRGGHSMALFLVLFNRCRVPPSDNLHFLSGRELKSLCQVGCSMSLYPLHLHLFESPDPDLH